VEAAREATCDLLRHESSSAKNGAYAALADAADVPHAAERGSDVAGLADAARAVLVGAAVTGEIIAGGLGHMETRANAARCLQVIASNGKERESALTAAAAAALLPW
jgi:hypothetical protein